MCCGTLVRFKAVYSRTFSVCVLRCGGGGCCDSLNFNGNSIVRQLFILIFSFVFFSPFYSVMSQILAYRHISFPAQHTQSDLFDEEKHTNWCVLTVNSFESSLKYNSPMFINDERILKRDAKLPTTT